MEKYLRRRFPTPSDNHETTPTNSLKYWVSALVAFIPTLYTSKNELKLRKTETFSIPTQGYVYPKWHSEMPQLVY